MVIDEQPVRLKEGVHDDGPPMLLRITLVASCVETARVGSPMLICIKYLLLGILRPFQFIMFPAS